MPHTLATGDYIRHVHWSYLSPQNAANVYYHRIGSITSGPFTDTDLTSALPTQMSLDLTPLMTGAAKYLGCTVKVIGPSTFQTQTSSLFATDGTAGTDRLPGQVAALIKRRADTGGAKGRGRVFIPFPDEIDNSTSGRLSAGYVADAETLASHWMESFLLTVGAGSVQLFPVIWPGIGVPVVVPLDVTAHLVEPTWATIRSRASRGRLGQNPWYYAGP